MARLAACSILLLGWSAMATTPAAAAASVDKMLNPTPLVLKDGRIAEVSVHTVPFPGDAVAPASKVKSQLDAFTQTIATDCFLTAQVIGHVDKSETSGRETADIHRLARARADTIQASLIESGLPAASIASVWDWRFMVQQARVTLWVFRLTAGEDCEDQPLGSGGSERIAADSTREAPTGRTLAEATEAPAAARAQPVPASVVDRQIVPAAKPKGKIVTERIPAVPKDASPDGAKTATSDEASSPEASATGKTQVAAIDPKAAVDPRGSIKIVEGGVLEVVFATNSSYFPEGAGERLRAFMKTLDKSRRYVLHIRTSVDGAAGVSGASSTEEAARYNSWLAERRFQRVQAWLENNSEGRKLTLEPSFIENDSSRRVRVEPAPLG